MNSSWSTSKDSNHSGGRPLATGKTSEKRLAGWEFQEEPKDSEQPFFLHVASTEADFEAVDMLWEAVYGEECGWLPAANGPWHKDRYDDQSVYLLARAEGRVVGTMRLVVDGAGGLPIEQFVPVDDLRDQQRRLIECQRLMILPDFRNRRYDAMPYGVLAALVKGCIHWCIVHNITHIVADLFTDTKTTPIGPLIALGFEETGKEFIDTELEGSGRSIALLLRVAELFSRPFRTSAPFYRYVMEYDGSVDVYR
ncbi:GNAT family N-acyltransferase [Streptomyces sp. NPDC048057]|uniref:N-acyl amino acid synthase FeeM domain-containing protein n=1 Tax=Streptomyces sp. NPDC048057 TaxID=3155628 RepID=UPI0033C07780